MLDYLPLHDIRIFSRPPFTLLMKLRVKFKFHGPPFELLHHFEASYELDYRIKAESFNLSLLIEIWKAL